MSIGSYLWAGIDLHIEMPYTLHPGIWSVKGNTTQTIQSYPYYNIQCITDTAYIYIYIYTSASKIFMHWLQARFSSGKHPYISMPIIRLCLGAIFARMASSSSTDNRPLYVQFCLPPEIHQQVAKYTQAEPLGIHERSRSTRAAWMLLHTYNRIIPGSLPLFQTGFTPVLG